MRYAAKTTVPAQRTRSEIESTIRRYGADQFVFGQSTDEAVLQFRLTRPHPLVVRFRLSLAKTDAQAQRQRWRALLLVIKAKLEAIETGIETVEHAFLAEIVLPDGKTMAESVVPQIRQLLADGRLPTALLEFQA